MSRRAPPREYYEEDFEIERERDQYSRPRRRDRHFEEEEDVEIRRRRSIPPVEELERLDIRERPPRDFMRESYASPRERGPVVMRRSRDEVDDLPRERRRYRPREIDEELIIDERDIRGDRRRRSERDLVEDDVVIRRRERAPRRGYESEGEFGPRGRFDDERDDIYVRRTVPRRKPRYSQEEIEELLIDESEMERPRPRKSRDDPQFDRRKSFEAFVLDDSGPDLPRRRRSHGDREVEEELIIDERERERPQDRRSHERPRRKEEIVMKWKDRPSPDELDEDEIHFQEMRRHRRSPPDPRLSREPADAWPSDREDQGPDEEIRFRSRMRSRPRHAKDDEEEEIIIRRQERERRRRAEEETELALVRDERERDRRRAIKDDEELIIRHKDGDRRRSSLEDDEIMLRKNKRCYPSRDRSPSLKSIHAPPIHQDIITHHRHIDHGFDRPPRAPSPEISSTRTSFDEVDVHHRRDKDGHMSEEDIVFKHRDGDESVSPTSGPSLGFNDAWEAGRMTSRHKPKSPIDENESMAAGSSHSRSRRKSPRGFDLDADEDDVEEDEEEVVVHETRSASRSRNRSPIADPRAAPDEWSMVHTPAKDEAVEMSGALKVVEVAPKGALDEEVERDRVGAQVVKERRDERWTEITKDLVVREAIERLGYEFEETRLFYYIFSFMEPGDIDELVELSDEIRQARRRRIREMHRERATLPPRPRPLVDRMPPRPRMAGERRVREREWIIDARR